jgi:AraC-like DNA-binding protein
VSLAVVHHDSALGRWTHCELRPPALAAWVDFLWHFEGHVGCARERNFPSGRVELILHLGPRYWNLERGARVLCPQSCVTGLQTGPLVIEAPGGEVRVMGLRLAPLGAFAVLGLPLAELAGLTVDLEALVGREAVELTERCALAPDGTASLELAAAWLARRLAAAPARDPAIAWVARAIERARGAIGIGALRDRAGLSATRLAEGFRAEVGVTPKLYARLHRFRHALDRLHQGEANLAELALATGHYDQPHFNAEFRAFAELTPTEFLAARHYPGSPSLPEAAPAAG